MPAHPSTSRSASSGLWRCTSAARRTPASASRVSTAAAAVGKRARSISRAARSSATRKKAVARPWKLAPPPLPKEHDEQAAVIQWWRYYSASKKLDERLLFAIPNGTLLAGSYVERAIQMAKLKAEGLRVGFPDLCLAVLRGGFGALYVEMKRRDGGRTSPAQEDVQLVLMESGYRVVSANWADQAIRAICEYVEGASTV